MKYFYGHLRAIYTNQYDALFKDVRMIDASKREWAENIIGYSKAQIDKGLRWVKTQMENHEDGWEFCSIGRCVGALKAANEVKASHKPFKRELAITDQGAIDRAKKANVSAMEGWRK